LLLSGQFRVKLASSLALVALVIPSLLYVTIGQGGALNLALSLATYSGLYLLVLAPTSYTGEERLRYWERLVLFVAVVVVTIGLAQLVSKGFPIRLPYIDYSPDVFVGPYGAGGHRLVPI